MENYEYPIPELIEISKSIKRIHDFNEILFNPDGFYIVYSLIKNKPKNRIFYDLEIYPRIKTKLGTTVRILEGERKNFGSFRFPNFYGYRINLNDFKYSYYIELLFSNNFSIFKKWNSLKNATSIKVWNMDSNSNKLIDMVLELSKFHDFDRIFILRGWLFHIPIISKPKQRIFYTLEIHKNTFKLFGNLSFVRTLRERYIFSKYNHIMFTYVITNPNRTIGNLNLDFFFPPYTSIPDYYIKEKINYGYETIEL